MQCRLVAFENEALKLILLSFHCAYYSVQLSNLRKIISRECNWQQLATQLLFPACPNSPYRKGWFRVALFPTGTVRSRDHGNPSLALRDTHSWVYFILNNVSINTCIHSIYYKRKGKSLVSIQCRTTLYWTLWTQRVQNTRHKIEYIAIGKLGNLS